MSSFIPKSVTNLLRRSQRRSFLRLWGRGFLIGAGISLVAIAGILLSTSRANFRPNALPLQNGTFLIRLTWLSSMLCFILTVSAALAWWLVPPRARVALELDHSFHLKERLTTLLSLDEKTASTPTGQALLSDTEARAANLDLGRMQPLTPSRWSLLLPLLLIGCLLTILYCERPVMGENAAHAGATPLKPETKKRLAEEFEDLKDVPPAGDGDVLSHEELGSLQKEYERLSSETPQTQQEARKALGQATELADRLRKKARELKARDDAFRQQMEEMARLSRNRGGNGARSQMENSLSRGDFQQAREDALQLSRQLEKDNLTPEQKQALQEQLQNLEDQLQSMTDEERQKQAADQQLGDLKDQLGKMTNEEIQKLADQEGLIDPKDLKDSGKLSDEDIRELKQQLENAKEADVKRALTEMKENGRKLSKEDVAKLKEQLKNARKLLAEDQKKAAEAMKQAGDQLGKMGQQNQKDQIAARLQKLAQLQTALGKASGRPPGMGQRGGSRGVGRRSQGEEGKTKTVDSVVPGQRGRGQLTGTRTIAGQGVKLPVTASQQRRVIRDAERAAAEALDRQEVSPSGEVMTRKYFEKLRKSK